MPRPSYRCKVCVFLILCITLLGVLIVHSSIALAASEKQPTLKAKIGVEAPPILFPNNKYIIVVKIKCESSKPLYEASLSVRVLIDQPIEVYDWNRRDHGSPAEYYAWLYYYDLGNLTNPNVTREVKIPLEILPHAYSGSHTILVSIGAYTNKSLTWESWRYSEWHPITLLVLNPIDSAIVFSFIGVLVTSTVILASIAKYGGKKRRT